MPSPNYGGTELFPDGQRRRGWGREQYWSELSQTFSPLSVFAGGRQGIYIAPWETSTILGSDGITPIAGFDQSVGKIADLSGRGNSITQSTISKQLIYKLDGNNKPYLYSDGIDDFLYINTLDLFRAVPGGTIVTALRFRALPTASKPVFSASLSSTSTTSRFTLYGNTGGVIAASVRRLDADTATTISTPATTQLCIVTLVVDFTDRTMSLRVNGIEKAASSAVITAGVTEDLNSMSVFLSGRTGDVSAPLDLYALMVTPSILSLSEIINFENFFKQQAGI